jgi:hypothetical protein
MFNTIKSRITKYLSKNCFQTNLTDIEFKNLHIAMKNAINKLDMFKKSKNSQTNYIQYTSYIIIDKWFNSFIENLQIILYLTIFFIVKKYITEQQSKKI